MLNTQQRNDLRLINLSVMIPNHSHTHSYPGSDQRFTAEPEPISLIGRQLAGCTGRETHWINRAAERINVLLHSRSLRLLPPITLFYSFVSLPSTVIMKHVFPLCHSDMLMFGSLMNLNQPSMNRVACVCLHCFICQVRVSPA